MKLPFIPKTKLHNLTHTTAPYFEHLGTTLDKKTESNALLRTQDPDGDEDSKRGMRSSSHQNITHGCTGNLKLRFIVLGYRYREQIRLSSRSAAVP